MVSPEISAFLQQHIDANDFPSAVYLVAEKGEIRFHDALGYAVVEPERIPARVDTLYDLASLTKVLVTTPLAADLMISGTLELDEPFLDYFDPLDAVDKRGITVREVATHTSGFKGWLPFYLLVSERSEVLGEILRTPLNHGGNPVVYSDLNFMLLMFIIERLLDERVDEAARRMIFRPLGLSESDVAFNPLRDSLITRIAASEHGNRYERQMCAELGFLDGFSKEQANRYFRPGTILGEVHDGNAYFMDGISGHAGLFATAKDVLRIATYLLRPEFREFFATNFTPGMNEHRSFGFELASTPDSTAGTLMSPQSYGHLGFTGTSLWIDPIKERIFVLLTNRTHNHPLPFVNINSVRRHFHDLAITRLDRN